MTGGRIIVVPDLAALVETATKRIAARIEQSEGRITICLTGGSTPKPIYERLAAEPYLSKLPWNRIHWFWGDERFVTLEDSRSNAGMTLRALLSQVPVPFANVHPIPTGAASPDEAAHIYELALKRHYGRESLDPARPLFDLVLLGLGSDGHTASLFPGDPALEEGVKWAVGVQRAGLAPFVPRVTLTFPTLSSTRELLFLVSGEEKREVLARVLASEQLPASRAHSAGALVWLVDQVAASDGL